jgi:hypothetical protein
MANRLPGVFVVGSALAFAACGGEGLTLPPEGEAANITVTWGDGQSGRVGTPLADSVVVQVTDVRGREVPNATVNFTFPDANGEATPAAVPTNSAGIAWAKVTLNAVGAISGLVEVPVDPGITPVRATFTATALPGDANEIVMVSGNEQSGAVGTDLREPLVVEVRDENGNPISGMPVTWTVAGGGSVTPTTTITGDNGQASVTRTLGPAAGQQTTLATADGLAGSPVTFTHVATAGTANRIIKVSGDGQSAPTSTEVRDPLVVQVLDANDNAIPNEPVTWVPASGGGSVSSPNTTTDAQGFASTRWTLGPSAGTNTVTAVASRAGTSTVAFTATATAGTPSATNSTVSASPGTITAGSGSSTITVTVRDASDNPVSGVSVTVTSSGSGNTITPPSASTGGTGVATFTFASTVAETKTITATAGGVELTQKPTITVQKASSTVEITSDEDDPSAVNEPITVEFTVRASGGVPTGAVTVRMDEAPNESCTGTLSNGTGSCSLTPTVPGTGTNNRRVIRATYAGDTRFSGDDDTENHRVTPVQAPNQPPTAAFTPPPCTAGSACQFTDGSTDADGTVVGWAWVFDDPASGSANESTLKNPTHTFASAGTYNVKLTARDDDGATDDVTETVTVTAAGNTAPVAVADAYSTPQNTVLTVGFPGLLGNDTDAEQPGNTLSSEIVTQPSTGFLTEFDTDGSFNYDPQSATPGMVVTFTYRVRDTQGAVSGPATVSITITE